MFVFVLTDRPVFVTTCPESQTPTRSPWCAIRGPVAMVRAARAVGRAARGLQRTPRTRDPKKRAGSQASPALALFYTVCFT